MRLIKVTGSQNEYWIIFTFLFSFSGLILLVNSWFGEIASQSSEDDMEIKFAEFKTNFSKIYKNQLEEEKRFEIFKSKMLAIEQHNARTDVSFKKGNTTL